MTYQEIGIYGTSRQSWKEDRPRALLLALYEKHKTYSTARLLVKFMDEVIDDKEYLEPIIETWFTNAMQSLKSAKEAAEQSSASKREREEAFEKEVTKTADKIKERIVMLALTMPNGKTMRFCTGAEMVQFGGWYAKIGKKVGGSKRVGEVLSEDEVWELKIG